MNQPSDQHATLGWLQALPLIVIGALAIALWRPALDRPPSPEQEAKIADLAARLGSPSSTAVDIDDRLRSFGPFPPDATASRALAEALVMCETTWLDESQRTQLARHLYGITVIGDNHAQAIPEAVIGIQKLMAAVGPACGPGVIERAGRAARGVASTDPHPRRDWW
jgi:hypothetical protein